MANYQKAAGRTLRRRASLASVTVAVILIAVKLWAWLATGSLALLTSAVDAMVDAGAAVVTFVGVRYAERPSDHEHRYGHGKGESVAAFVQAILLCGAALALAVESVDRLIVPAPLADLGLGLAIAVGSVCVAAALVALQTVVVRRTDSIAIAADRAHYRADVAVNLAVVAAFAVTRLTGWQRADPAFALLIAAYMLWTGRNIAAVALHQLLDRELSSDVRQRIEQVILATPGVSGLHDLRTRTTGDRTFVDFHLEVAGLVTVDRGHEIGDLAEAAVTALFPAGADVTAHLEPAGIRDERLDAKLTT
jgi:ferrous-iron efflux pump FieF